MAVLPAWDDTLGVGVPLLDQQLREFYDFGRQVEDRVAAMEAELDEREKEKARRDIEADLVYGLADLFMEHFTTEESLMAAVGYPLLEGHREQHRSVSRRVLGHVNAHISRQPLDLMAVMGFALSWLQAHVAGQERAFISWYRSQQQGDA